MSKIVSIALSLLLLLQSINVGVQDVLELDDFVAHARFHYEQYGDSFAIFLSKHYGQTSKNHLPKDKAHGELPFQHHCSLSSCCVFVIDPAREYGLLNFQDDRTSQGYFYRSSDSDYFEDGPFQPPKHA